MAEDNIKDVDYSNIDSDGISKEMRGKVLYFTPSQVADTLKQTVGAVNYYRVTFKEILDIPFIDKHWRYTEEAIVKLRFMFDLKEQGLTLRQIAEYCSEVSFENGKGVRIKESNPLSIKALAKTLLDEQNRQLEEFKIEMEQKFINTMKQNYNELGDKIIEQVSLNIEDMVGNKINEVVESQKEIKEHSTELEGLLKNNTDVINEVVKIQKEIKEHDVELVGLLKNNMNERKEESLKLKEIMKQQQSRSFWEKLVELFRKQDHLI